jgi:regulation of enolase protein 1 (concanavalin A-like superfamily)
MRIVLSLLFRTIFNNRRYVPLYPTRSTELVNISSSFDYLNSTSNELCKMPTKGSLVFNLSSSSSQRRGLSMN